MIWNRDASTWFRRRGEPQMNKILVGLLGCASLTIATVAAGEPGKGPKGEGQPKQQQQHDGKGSGSAGRAKHQHHAKNGRALLGAKLKQDGKHAVGRFKNREVVAEVKGGKVHAMKAGDLEAKRVRTKTKMVLENGRFINPLWDGGSLLRLAQYGGGEDYYYGYCFDDGYEYECYWYPAEDVDYQDYSWEEYDPYW
jgi:hypothetical protein